MGIFVCGWMVRCVPMCGAQTWCQVPSLITLRFVYQHRSLAESRTCYLQVIWLATSAQRSLVSALQSTGVTGAAVPARLSCGFCLNEKQLIYWAISPPYNKLIFRLLIICVCIHMCTHVWCICVCVHAVVCMWRSEDNCIKLTFLMYLCVGSRDQTFIQ